MTSRAKTPTDNAPETISYGTAPSTLGFVLVAQSATGVCGVLMGDSPKTLRAELRERFPAARLTPDPAALSRHLRAVVRMIENPRTEFKDTLDARGTDFQKNVWRMLRKIPAGQTISYTTLAQRMNAPKAVRAVASACAANPLAVVIPCHRVVRTTGALAGYRWGLARKQALLEREGATV